MTIVIFFLIFIKATSKTAFSLTLNTFFVADNIFNFLYTLKKDDLNLGLVAASLMKINTLENYAIISRE